MSVKVSKYLAQKLHFFSIGFCFLLFLLLLFLIFIILICQNLRVLIITEPIWIISFVNVFMEKKRLEVHSLKYYKQLLLADKFII